MIATVAIKNCKAYMRIPEIQPIPREYGIQHGRIQESVPVILEATIIAVLINFEYCSEEQRRSSTLIMLRATYKQTKIIYSNILFPR